MSRANAPTSPHFPFSLPPTAIASILHRVTGVGLFVLLGPVLWLAHVATQSAESFGWAQTQLSTWWGSFLIFGFFSCLGYHALAAIRHTLQDMGFGENLKSGNESAIALFIATALFEILLITRIWF